MHYKTPTTAKILLLLLFLHNDVVIMWDHETPQPSLCVRTVVGKTIKDEKLLEFQRNKLTHYYYFS